MGSEQPGAPPAESGTVRRDSGHGGSPSLRALAPWCFALGVVYFVLLGGSGIGELLPSLKLADGLLGAGLIGYLLVRMPSDADRLDKATLLALLAFLAAAVLSRFGRQSLSAALAAFAYVGLFYATRRWLRDDRWWQVLLTGLRTLSLVLVPLIAAAWGLTVWRWLAAVQFRAPPPLDMSALPSFVWGQRHDVALLLVVLTASFWSGKTTIAERMVRLPLAALTGAAVVIDGSRNLWAALAIATVTVLWTRHGTRVWSRVRTAAQGRSWQIGVLALLLLVGALIVGDAIGRRLLFVQTLGARGGLWSASAQAWLLNPLAGLGPGSFPWDLQLTSYFNNSAFAPRHPDSALFQDLAEAGVLGCAALATLLYGAIATIRRHRPEPTALFVLVTIVAACVGANPTDFSFLVVLLILWAARALPSPPVGSTALSFRIMPLYRMTASVLCVGIAASFVSTSIAAFAYQAASEATAVGDRTAARGSLDQAVALDPGLSLYLRDQGLLAVLGGDTRGAIGDLVQATHLNPSDIVTWRGLTIAYDRVGNLEAARTAAETAVARKGTSYRSLILLASVEAQLGDENAASMSLARAVALAPWSSELTTFGFGMTPTPQLVRQALLSWRSGGSPIAIGPQAAWLVGITDETASESSAVAAYPQAGAAMTAIIDITRGDDAAARRELSAAFAHEYDQPWYWAARYLLAQSSGHPDDEAVAVLRVIWPALLEQPDLEQPLLSDSTTPGFSEDRWGYRRIPLPLADFGPKLSSGPAALAAAIQNAGGPAHRP